MTSRQTTDNAADDFVDTTTQTQMIDSQQLSSMNWLKRKIINAASRDHVLLYSFKTWIFAFILSTAAYLAYRQLVGTPYKVPTGMSKNPNDYLGILPFIVSAIIIPPAETAFLLLVLRPLQWMLKHRLLIIAVITGVLAGLAHGIFSAAWFIGPAVGFTLFCYASLCWQSVRPKGDVWVLILPHMMQNAAVYLFMNIAAWLR